MANRQTSNQSTYRTRTTMKTDLDDDWETDPDFVRDMDEMDQRWGSKRTVGKINMNELIDEVRKDHKIMREKFDHPSQRDYSEGFGGKFGIQHDRKDQSAAGYDYHEKLSKHTSQEISRKIITSSSSSSIIKNSTSGISDAKKIFMEREEDSQYPGNIRPNTSSSSENIGGTSYSSKPYKSTSSLGSSAFDGSTSGLRNSSSGSPRFEESSSTTRKIIREEKSSSSNDRADIPPDMPATLESIQDKINKFKKEFEELESKVAGAKKSGDVTHKLIKTSNIEKSNNVEFVTRSGDNNTTTTTKSYSTSSNVGGRPAASSKSPLFERDMPKSSIKSLSEKFENLCHEESENFRRETGAKRREFFDQIKNQVRETRKDLEGFDAIDDSDGEQEEDYDNIRRRMREHLDIPSMSTTSKTTQQQQQQASPTRSATSPSSRPSSRLSGLGSPSSSALGGGGRPKIYTRRETTEEKIVSKLVKENDKIIEDETKRDVKRSSSCHGSSEDEDNEEPNSIKFIDRELRKSSSPLMTSNQQHHQVRVESPLYKSRQSPTTMEQETKGAGLMARTLYDYEATEDDELTFDVDDLITNIEKVDKGWYKGTITYKDGERQVGLFPANYVRLLNDTGEY